MGSTNEKPAHKDTKGPFEHFDPFCPIKRGYIFFVLLIYMNPHNKLMVQKICILFLWDKKDQNAQKVLWYLYEQVSLWYYP